MIYAIIYAVGVIYGLILSGKKGDSDMALAAIIWPCVVVFCFIASPYYLGLYIRKHTKRN